MSVAFQRTQPHQLGDPVSQQLISSAVSVVVEKGRALPAAAKMVAEPARRLVFQSKLAVCEPELSGTTLSM